MIDDEPAQALLAELEGRALVRLQPAEQLAGVLFGEEALGYDGEHVPVHRHRDEDDRQDDGTGIQRPVQALLIDPRHPADAAVRKAGEPSALAGRLGPADQIGAHHRRGAERQRQGDDDRRRQGDGELAEQPPDDAAHQQNGDEDGDQGQGHGQDREAHLLRALQRRLEARHALLHVAGGVFHHHDGVVDDKSGGHGQGHQGQVVQAETQQVHHAERSQQGHGHAHAGDQGAPPLCRKNATTPTTRTTEMARVRSTSAREARMVTERSSANCTSISAGRAASMAGRRFLIIPTV